MNVYQLRFKWAVLVLGLALFLAGCSPIMRSKQMDRSGVVGLEAGQTVGQTFTADFNGLNTIEIETGQVHDADENSQLTLSLYRDTAHTDVLFRVSEPVRPNQSADTYRFRFPALQQSNGMGYYAVFALQGAGKIEILTGPGENYLNGAFYIDHRPIDAQGLFRLGYALLPMELGLVGEVLGWLPKLLLGLGLFMLPGWALLSYTWLVTAWSKWDVFEKAMLATGVGLALYPVLFLWASQLGLNLGILWVWSVPGVSLVLLAVRLARAWQTKRPKFHFAISSIAWDEAMPWIALTAIVVLIVGLRFWALRALAAPLWGDSYQHTVMAQRIIETGGLFSSWQPYTPFKTMTVQFGFPVGAALWAWGSGQTVSQATLWFGQFLNIIAVCAMYPLGMWISKRNRWAAVAAVAVAGLLSQFPAMYLNWGRYAQLAGQAILPVALVLIAHSSLERSRMRWLTVVPLSIAIAGMLLAYYRMAFYFAAFVPGLMVFSWFAFKSEADRTRRMALLFVYLALSSLIVLVWIAPWMSNVVGSSLADKVEAGVTGTTVNVWNSTLGDYRSWLSFFDYVPIGFALVSIVALAVAVWRRAGRVWLIPAWIIVLGLVRAGVFIHLPGANLMQSSAILIALYMPVSLLIGWLFAWLVGLSANLNARYRQPLLAAILVLTIAVGINVQQRFDGGKRYQLVTNPDLRAMAWIKSNTPQDAVFLVEAFRIYRGTSVVGSDAGWWIPLLSGRQTVLPPQYALLNELPEQSGYSQRLVDLVTVLEDASPEDPRAVQMLCNWGITHIYIGQQQGMASEEHYVLFTPQEIQELPVVYAQDRVRIYTFDRHKNCP